MTAAHPIIPTMGEVQAHPPPTAHPPATCDSRACFEDYHAAALPHTLVNSGCRLLGLCCSYRRSACRWFLPDSSVQSMRLVGTLLCMQLVRRVRVLQLPLKSAAAETKEACTRSG